MSRQNLNIEARKAIEDHERQIEYLKSALDRAHEIHNEATKRHTAEIDQLRAHVLVLQGDRDALTRTLEVCTRRLSSPTADKDPSRGGWRSANLIAVDHTAKARG
jgi:chromosome segregation ATPase